MTYAADGLRAPFDPATVGAHLDGCLLCGAAHSIIGVFIPQDDAMRIVVLRLRRTVPPRNGTAALAYALCDDCYGHTNVTDEVEAALTDAAARLVIQ
jgi:hypothetical protein